MTPFQRWLVWTSSAATGVTGLVYAWMRYVLEPVGPWAVVHHPWEPWVLKAHVLAAPVLVFAFGLIAVDHVWKHFRCRVPLGRRSGLAAAVVFGPMVATGYLIQVVTHVGWLRALAWGHLATGILYLVFLVAHQKVFRARSRGGRARREERAVRPPGDEPAPPVVPGRRRTDPVVHVGDPAEPPAGRSGTAGSPHRPPAPLAGSPPGGA